MNRNFLKDFNMAKKYMKKCSASLIRELKIKTRISHQSLAHITKNKTTSVGVDMG